MSETEWQGAAPLGRAAAIVREHAAELLPLLRIRPGTREEALRLLDAAEASTVLDALVASGLVAESGGSLEYLDPEPLIASLAAQVLDDEQQRLAELSELVSQLPELTRAWQLGSAAEGQQIQGEIARGTDQAMTRWFEISARLAPQNPCAVVPDLGWIRRNFAPMLELGADAFPENFEARYLFTSSALEDDEDRQIVDMLVGLGAQIRLSPRLPGWFSLERDSMACLPTAWGATSPEGIAFIYSAPVVSAVQTLFDALWASAAPYPQSGQSWQTVLDLMGRGKSDEQIAEALGLGLRTVRRRVAEAMDELGVNSRFELGAAWAGREW
jgi:hypothetical protein